MYLQFGHGTEPWRNFDPRNPEATVIDILQFGHGTEPWRNLLIGRSATRPVSLQFGHGTEPWRNADRWSDSSRACGAFNSATARSRGETQFRQEGHSLASFLQFGHGTEPWRNSVAGSSTLDPIRALQFGHGTEPWRNGRGGEVRAVGRDPSIRPRHGAVEKRQAGTAGVSTPFNLQFGHGTEPWRNSADAGSPRPD